jgi:uncharacterized protein (TIRG00374 family)
MRRILFLIASVLVSALFLWLALRGVDWQAIIDRLRQANPVWVLLSLALMSLGLFTRAIRWRGLLDFKIPLSQAFHVLNIGFLLNLLPLRAGEFARMVLATRSKVPLVTAATSVVFERLIDTLLVVIVLVVALTRLPNADPAITKPTMAFGVAAVLAFVVLIFFARFPDLAHRVLKFLERFLPFLKRLPLEKLLDNVLEGLKPLTHWRSAVFAVGWTLISWGVSFLTLYAVERALNIDTVVLPNGQPVDLIMLDLLGLTLASFSAAIPVSVMSLGPFEAAMVVAGQAVGLNGSPDLAALALSLGFLFHGVNIVGYSFWGLIGLLATGVSLSDVMSARDKGQPEAAQNA